MPMPRMYLFKSLSLKVMLVVDSALGYASFVAAVAVLGTQGLSSVQHLEKYFLLQATIRAVHDLETPFLAYIHKHMTADPGGRDMAPFILGAALAALWIAAELALHQLRVLRFSLVQRQERDDRAEAASRLRHEAQRKAEVSGKAVSSEDARLAAEAATDPSQREKVLELYAKTKKILEEQKKNLSFLAIDVVDSTSMKKGEDPAIAERDFRQYRKLVERIIEANKGLKAAWTPDGVMICFASVQNAVQAAQELIRTLDHFNREVKTLKADFKVRCGINAGRVLFDDGVPMEQMSDRNIDIAGHMQKYAGANTIFIGAAAIEGMRAQFGFRPAKKEVDGCEVYEWSADAAGDSVPSA